MSGLLRCQDRLFLRLVNGVQGYEERSGADAGRGRTAYRIAGYLRAPKSPINQA